MAKIKFSVNGKENEVSCDNLNDILSVLSINKNRSDIMNEFKETLKKYDSIIHIESSNEYFFSKLDTQEIKKTNNGYKGDMLSLGIKYILLAVLFKSTTFIVNQMMILNFNSNKDDKLFFVDNIVSNVSNLLIFVSNSIYWICLILGVLFLSGNFIKMFTDENINKTKNNNSDIKIIEVNSVGNYIYNEFYNSILKEYMALEKDKIKIYSVKDKQEVEEVVSEDNILEKDVVRIDLKEEGSEIVDTNIQNRNLDVNVKKESDFQILFKNNIVKQKHLKGE